MVELDKTVMEVVREHMPSVAGGALDCKGERSKVFDKISFKSFLPLLNILGARLLTQFFVKGILPLSHILRLRSELVSPALKVIVGDAIKYLEDSRRQGRQFDFIFGDLTDIPIDTDHNCKKSQFGVK